MCAALAFATEAPARADQLVLLASQWPSVPEGHELSLEDQVTERINQVGNQLGEHLDLLSHDMVQLHIDARHRRAHVHVECGSSELLGVGLDSDIQFDDENAFVHARLDLGFHGHSLEVALPAVEMSPVAYRGDYGVEIKLPLFIRQF
ncbi:MAG TPA: hypothetical protein VH165_35495 [Kofleriaceae bacterium]|jgi:hypothetical protein|nr:hypothetical protein [Kofleriaceae bacterium]